MRPRPPIVWDSAGTNSRPSIAETSPFSFLIVRSVARVLANGGSASGIDEEADVLGEAIEQIPPR